MRHVEVRSGLYRDSVRLMQISTALAGRADVGQALVAMATAVNLELLAGMGFAAPPGAGPNDLIVAVAVTDEAAVGEVLAQLDTELSLDGRGGPTSLAGTPGPLAIAAMAPRTTGVAARGLAASVALISTPGRHAFVEAMDALDAGLSVLVFSDNVPVEQEVALKRVASERRLIVMGPDCGTAVLAGAGLGFANVVRPGPVGLVAASGTGAQQVMCLLAWAGVGISHCLGVGGRDLSAAVAGASTHAALDALDADDATELIVVVGKTPAKDVAVAVAEHARRLATPALVAPLGPDRPDLTALTIEVLARVGAPVPPWPSWPATAQLGRSATAAPGLAGGQPAALRGLFSGGTLALEAMSLATARLGPIRSNVPIHPQWTIASGTGGHLVLDLGADEYTVGRPHPMIDFGPRLDKLAEAAADPRCAVLLLDVVLGHGAHPDPAADLAPAIRAALERRTGDLAIVVSLVGTAGDPQRLEEQALRLRAAGASAYLSNAEATRRAVDALLGSPQ